MSDAKPSKRAHRTLVLGIVLVAVGIIGGAALTAAGLIGGYDATSTDAVPPEQKADRLARGIDVAVSAPLLGLLVAAIGIALIVIGAIRAGRGGGERSGD